MSIKVCYTHYGQLAILFVETFEAKTNKHFVLQYSLLHSLSFEKTVSISIDIV